MDRSRGPTGREGPPGREGHVGVTGDKGEPVEQGPKGDVGDRGPRGKTGSPLPLIGLWPFAAVILLCTGLLLLAFYFSGKAVDAAHDATTQSAKNNRLVKQVAKIAGTNSQLIAQNTELIAQSAELAAEGKQAHDILCVMKRRQERQLVNSEKFLGEHPQGAPPITAAIIKQSIAESRQDLTAMASLTCL